MIRLRLRIRQHEYGLGAVIGSTRTVARHPLRCLLILQLAEQCEHGPAHHKRIDQQPASAEAEDLPWVLLLNKFAT